MSIRGFIAIAPDAATALAIDAWRHRSWQCLRRPVPAQNFHITLSFLGKIDAVRQRNLEQQLDNLDESAVEIELDRPGYQAAGGIVWLMSSTRVAALESLALACRRMANRAGIRVDSRRYLPHLTLARGQWQPPPAPLVAPAFRIVAREIVLYQSILEHRGARYRALGSVALRAP